MSEPWNFFRCYDCEQTTTGRCPLHNTVTITPAGTLLGPSPIQAVPEVFPHPRSCTPGVPSLLRRSFLHHHRHLHPRSPAYALGVPRASRKISSPVVH